jgi:hypothetical protein
MLNKNIFKLLIEIWVPLILIYLQQDCVMNTFSLVPSTSYFRIIIYNTQPSNEASVVITRSVSFHLPPILESLYTAPQPSNEASVVITIGILVSVFTAVEYGPLHYRNLELQKIDQLKNCKDNYNSKMRITNAMKTDLRWWLENIQYQYSCIILSILSTGNVTTILTESMRNPRNFSF